MKKEGTTTEAVSLGVLEALNLLFAIVSYKLYRNEYQSCSTHTCRLRIENEARLPSLCNGSVCIINVLENMLSQPTDIFLAFYKFHWAAKSNCCTGWLEFSKRIHKIKERILHKVLRFTETAYDDNTLP